MSTSCKETFGISVWVWIIPYDHLFKRKVRNQTNFDHFKSICNKSKPWLWHRVGIRNLRIIWCDSILMLNPLLECISLNDCENNQYSCEHRPSFWNLKKRNEQQAYINISVIQFFAALGLAFIIKWVAFLTIATMKDCNEYFSGLLVYLMLRAFDCDAFPNCWFPPDGHEEHIQKQSKFWLFNNYCDFTSFYPRNNNIGSVKWYQANWN